MAIGMLATLACEDPATPVIPRGAGSLELNVSNVVGGCGSTVGLSGMLHIEGPTASTTAIAPNETRTIRGLERGTYTVTIEGFLNSEVVCTGSQTLTVDVGDPTQVSLSMTAFGVPAPSAVDAVTLGREVSVAFPAVPGANDYQLDFDSDAAFAPKDSSKFIPGGVTLTFPDDSGHHYLQIRARTRLLSVGRASATVATFVDPVTAVSAGGFHTCLVTVSAAAYCWGANSFGELGDGTGAKLESLVPRQVSSTLGFKSVAAGTYYTCGLTTTDAALCWGDNTFGQLGKGDTVTTDTPAAVTGGLSYSEIATSVSEKVTPPAATSHTCGLAISGALYCWGANAQGQLGLGDTVLRMAPAGIPGHTFSAVSVGGFHTCGLESGAALCWGYNLEGELGDGTQNSATSPLAALGGHTFSRVSGNGKHTCATAAAGVVYCWGWNSNGQLGHGDAITTPTDGPRQVTSSPGLGIVTAGSFSSCGLTQSRLAYCWGANPSGELGNNESMTQHDTPVPVADNHQFVAISAGANYVCAIDAAGAVYCWGFNAAGQLGDGTKTERHVPVRVKNP